MIPSRLAKTIVSALVGLLGLFVTYSPSILSGFRTFQPNAIDTPLNHYILEHGYRWAFDRDYPFDYWSPGFFTPTKLTFAYSETLIGSAPVYWALRGSGFEPVAAYGIWILLWSYANYASMLIVLRWFGTPWSYAVAGATVFGFGLLRIFQMEHHQLLTQAATPFVLYAAAMFLRSPARKYLAAVIAGTAWQMLASIYLGWFLGFSIGVLLFTGLAISRTTRFKVWTYLRTDWIAAVAMPAIAAVVLGAYLRPYLQANEGIRRPLFEIMLYSPRFEEWFLPTDAGWLYYVFGFKDYHMERHLFFGVAAWLMIVPGLCFAHRSKLRFPLVLTAITLVLLSTVIWGNFSLWWIVAYHVPGADAIRAVGRIALIVLPLLLLATCRGAAFAYRSWKGRFLAEVMGVLLIILALLETIPGPRRTFDVSEVYGPAAAVAERSVEADAIWFLPDGPDDRAVDEKVECQGMWASVLSGKPTINGYSGRWPKEYPIRDLKNPVESARRVLGPEFRGTLAIFTGPEGTNRQRWQIAPGRSPTRIE